MLVPCYVVICGLSGFTLDLHYLLNGTIFEKKGYLKKHYFCMLFWVITQKKAYNVQNTAKAWNQDHYLYFPYNTCLEHFSF